MRRITCIKSRRRASNAGRQADAIKEPPSNPSNPLDPHSDPLWLAGHEELECGFDGFGGFGGKRIELLRLLRTIRSPWF